MTAIARLASGVGALVLLVGCSVGGDADERARPARTESTSVASHAHDHVPDAPFTGPVDRGRTADGRRLTLVQTGTVLVTEAPFGAQPSAAQRRAADELAAATIASAVARYPSLDAALADGFVHLDGDPVHYVAPARLVDAHHADPEHPEALMWLTPEPGAAPVLLGAMFLEPVPTHGRQIGGPLTAWHYHEYAPEPYCVVLSGFPVGEPDSAGRCAHGELADRSPEMLHVWIRHPDGPFGIDVLTPEGSELTRLETDLEQLRKRVLETTSTTSTTPDTERAQ